MNLESKMFVNRLGTLQCEFELPQQKHIFNAMDALRWRSRANSSSQLNMMLIGESGVGKTHLARKYMDAINIQNEGSDEERISVLYVPMPFSFSLRAMYLSIQKSLGIPAPKTSRSTEGMRDQTISLVMSRKVEMIIFDEADHMLNPRNMAWFEPIESVIQLGQAANVSTVLIGSPLMQGLIQGELRYARRFSNFELCPLKNEDEVLMFLRSIEAQLDPLPIPFSDPDTQLPTLLHYWTRGLPGMLVPLIQLALRNLILRIPLDQIDMPHFLDALLEVKKTLLRDDDAL